MLKAYINKHLVNDFIRSFKSSIDVSILFVRKKNDNLRLCVNYRDLNALIVKNRYSLSLIDESLNRFNRVKRFTNLNLTIVYHRMRIKKSDEWKTIFRTRYDHFEYQILSFELINVSIIFQDFINCILTIKLNVNVIIYLNDIVIYFENSTTYLNDVKWMLNKLKEHKLYFSLNICEWFIDIINFLNFVVTQEKVKMQKAKIHDIRTWLTSKIVHEIMQFLKFVNFYKRFIKHFNKIATFLTKMLKESKKLRKHEMHKRKREEKSKSRNHERDTLNDFLISKVYNAFQKLRDVFLKVSILRHFDSTLSLRVKTNVFNKVINVIFNQFDLEDHWHLIAYYFRKMIFAKCNYETHNKELLIIVQTFKHWRHYFEKTQHEMLIFLDHKNFNRFMTTIQLSFKQIRWAQKLSRYHFVIDYRFDVKNSTNELFKRSNHMFMFMKEIENHKQILDQLKTSFNKNSKETFEEIRIDAMKIYWSSYKIHWSSHNTHWSSHKIHQSSQKIYWSSKKCSKSIDSH